MRSGDLAAVRGALARIAEADAHGVGDDAPIFNLDRVVESGLELLPTPALHAHPRPVVNCFHHGDSLIVECKADRDPEPLGRRFLERLQELT